MVKIGVEEARPIDAFFFISSGSSLLASGLVPESFGNYYSLVYEFTLFTSRRE